MRYHKGTALRGWLGQRVEVLTAFLGWHDLSARGSIIQYHADGVTEITPDKPLDFGTINKIAGNRPLEGKSVWRLIIPKTKSGLYKTEGPIVTVALAAGSGSARLDLFQLAPWSPEDVSGPQAAPLDFGLPYVRDHVLTHSGGSPVWVRRELDPDEPEGVYTDVLIRTYGDVVSV